MSKKSLYDSAQTLLKAGIDSYQQDDHQSAMICFALAEKLFADSDNPWNAHIARGWYESVPNLSERPGSI